MGSIVNGLAIFIMGFIGAFVKNHLDEKYTSVVIKGVSLAVVFVGISGAVKNLIDPNAHSFLFILCLSIGGLIGTFLNISDKLKSFGDKVQEKFSKNNNGFSEGFIYGTILFCTGAMAIIGSFESGVSGDNKTLYTKSVIDAVMALVLSSTMGIGVCMSGLSVILYEGLLVLVSGFISPYITNDMIREISIVGNILVTCIGLDILDILKIKVADFLPAAFLPIVYYLIF